MRPKEVVMETDSKLVLTTDHNASSAVSGKFYHRTRLTGITKLEQLDVFLYSLGVHNLVSRDLPAHQITQKLLAVPVHHYLHPVANMTCTSPS